MKLICELLVAMNIGILTMTLVRMPSGHNHADQDGKFGIIWLFTRDKYLLTPQRYRAAVKEALKNDLGGAKVHNLLVIPDYCAYLADMKDNKFALADKMHYTQHVWKFERTQVCTLTRIYLLYILVTCV